MTQFTIHSNLLERVSPLTCAVIDAYLDHRGRGDLAGIGCAVMAAAEKYGINATYIVAHAALETGWGRSRISKEKNNLFGWSAFDASPYSSATGFPNKAACIDYVMGRILELYLTPGGRYFVGCPCVGNKQVGMNVHYATDPRWGAKIASIARRIERDAI